MTHFDDPSFADVAFEFAGGEVVHAHKLLLALSSPTFAVMFSSGMAEAQGGRHTVAMDHGLCPFGAGTFRLALLYIYTGELPVLDTTATPRDADARAPPLQPTTEGVARLLELLLVADYLQCDHLKQLGERLVIDWEVLQVENVVDVFQHAVGSSCQQLRASCVQYIRGMYDVVQETEAWAALDDTLKKEVTELKRG